MRSNKRPRALEASLFVFASLWVAACSSSSGLNGSCSPTASSNVVSAAPAAASNVMTVTVNGTSGQCSPDLQDQYPNEPCTSVTICTHGSTTLGSGCAVINNLLVDTGSYGLRVFSSVLSNAGVTPSTIASGGGTLAECVGFGDGSSEFGQVGQVDVYMTGVGGEGVISNLPILLIQSLPSATPPFPCSTTNSTPDTSPSATGFNGILGVGLLAQDCGPDCETDNQNFQYFSCTSTTCNCSGQGSCPGGATATYPTPSSPTTPNQQVTNPVAELSVDNNGVILQLPGVPDGGSTSVTGGLILGIGTESNNKASGVQMYPADPTDLTFSAVFNPFSGNALTSFIDSGSSLLFFPWPPPSQPSNGTLPDCGGNLSGFYCPSGEQTFAAQNTGSTGSPTSCVGFNVANASSQLSGNSMVFNNLAGASGSDISSDFDWGLPFFLGRKVYVGISGTSATGLGTGPYWAY